MLKYKKHYEPLSDLLFTEPLAVPLAPLLASVGVHPNVLTFFSLIAGIGSGVLFATGHWAWAAIVFQCSYFFDCLDGKVARLLGIASEFGKKLDFIADSIRKPSSFLGIACFFYFTDNIRFTALTFVCFVAHLGIHKLYHLTGVGCYDLAFPVFVKKIVRRYAPRVVTLYGFDEEQFLGFVLFPIIAAILGLPEGAVYFFYGIGLGTTLSIIKILILWKYRLAGKYADVYQDWGGTGGALDKAEIES